MESSVNDELDDVIPISSSMTMNDALQLVPFPENVSEDASTSLISQETSNRTLESFESVEELSNNSIVPMKTHMPRTGRPCHPVWKHFHRGERQNRFHYRAYCRYCIEGVGMPIVVAMTKVSPVRGVSADMIKHLKQCSLCPTSLVSEFQLLKKSQEVHTKRPSKVALPHDEDMEATRIKRIKLWKATISAGLDLSWTEDPNISQLLKLPPLTTEDMLLAASELARIQFEKVKEGMLNSTIKGGLTLSINAWTNQRRQHLLAFSLMNSDGDACAISVVETANTVIGIEGHIRRVLRNLQRDNVCIVGIVADSILSWSAASRVHQTTFPELLVLPCVKSIINLLVGYHLTSSQQIETLVGTLVELCAWCRHPSILSSLGKSPRLPSRRDAISFIECMERFLELKEKLQEVIHHFPPELQSQACNESTFWSDLEELYTSIHPLLETHTALQSAKGAARTLSHVMYALGRLVQTYNNDLLNRIWQLYEMEAMVLAFRFDFHFDQTLLSTKELENISLYFATYSARWFGTTSPPSHSRIQDILQAVETNAFPFDCTRDYHDVSSFYSFVASSYPELCALCCRLYAISIFAAPVSQVIRGIGLVPSIAASQHNVTTVLPLLHIGFTTKPFKLLPLELETSTSRWMHAHETQVDCLFTRSDWKILAMQWKKHVSFETTCMPSPTADNKDSTSLSCLFPHPLDHIVFDSL